MMGLAGINFEESRVSERLFQALDPMDCSDVEMVENRLHTLDCIDLCVDDCIDQDILENRVMEEHKPVLLQETLDGLNIDADGIYVDATFGRGGHSRALLAKLSAKGRLYVMDKDPEAIHAAKALQASEAAQTSKAVQTSASEAVQAMDPRLTIFHGSFKNLLAFCQSENIVGKVSGVLMDLGVSSPQFNTPERGFSFRLEGPLDMRMDPTRGLSAAEWLNTAKENEIDEVLKNYGEERFHRRIARAIIQAREQAPMTTTVQFADIVAKAHPAWEKHKHPATRSFQAVRIFINDELAEISLALDQALTVLAPKGRLAVISFHSLEDRLVKQFIQKQERGDDYPALFPVRAAELNQRLRRVGRAIMPSVQEVHQNVRARSAVLRIAEKIGELA